MPISRFFVHPVEITTPSADPAGTTTDDDGVPIVGTTTVDALGHVQPYRPGADDEVVLGVEEARRARWLWLPLDTVITHRSTVNYRGERYTVNGDPDDFRVGSTNDHLQVLIVRQVRAS